MTQRSQTEDAALVLFSGGQDSATCLAWALARYPRVETVGFGYGQRHAVELDVPRAGARRRWRATGWARTTGRPDRDDRRARARRR